MNPLTQVLLGITPPSRRVPLDNIVFFDEHLNESQREAVQFCLESPEVACIHGPPGMFTFILDFPYSCGSGTGKTHTLIEIIRQLTAESLTNPKPKRLLVCGASNLSVDNILERLLALPAEGKSEKLKVTRIGHPARVMTHEGIIESTLEVKATRTEQVRSSHFFSEPSL